MRATLSQEKSEDFGTASLLGLASHACPHWAIFTFPLDFHCFSHLSCSTSPGRQLTTNLFILLCLVVVLLLLLLCLLLLLFPPPHTTPHLTPLAIMARSSTLPSICRSCLQSTTTRPITKAGRPRLLASTIPYQTITSRELHGVDWSKPSPPSGRKPNSESSEPDALLTQALSSRNARTTNQDISVWRRTTRQQTMERDQENEDRLAAVSPTTGFAGSSGSPHSNTGPGGIGSGAPEEPYHIHVYAHKHNMHLTLTEPGRSPILSLSAGKLGLRNSQRATYDACYQLTTYFFRKMMEKQWRLGGKKATSNPLLTFEAIKTPRLGNKSLGIEVVFRGFGPGREAFQKCLLGTEGKFLRGLISRVTDSTRLKFGGCRSRNVRRLG